MSYQEEDKEKAQDGLSTTEGRLLVDGEGTSCILNGSLGSRGSWYIWIRTALLVDFTKPPQLTASHAW